MRQQSDREKDEFYDKRRGIGPTHPRLSIQQQSELLGVPRSPTIKQPRPESAENMRLLRLLDRLCLKCPFTEMAHELAVNRGLCAEDLHPLVDCRASAQSTGLDSDSIDPFDPSSSNSERQRCWTTLSNSLRLFSDAGDR